MAASGRCAAANSTLAGDLALDAWKWSAAECSRPLPFMCKAAGGVGRRLAAVPAVAAGAVLCWPGSITDVYKPLLTHTSCLCPGPTQPNSQT